jgi:AcrR family transcriptional regulator
MVSQQSPARPSSRDRLLIAATAEFAAHGFDGTTVDRIAARARINKAMVYYHFHDKAALYRAILLDVFRTVAAALGEAPVSGDARTRLRGFIRTVASHAIGRPHFPVMWLREIADGGRHVDAEVVTEMGKVLGTLGGILQAGAEQGVFRPAHPLIVQMNIVGPLLVFSASAPARARLAKNLPKPFGTIEAEAFLAHVETATMAALQPDPAPHTPTTRSRRQKS